MQEAITVEYREQTQAPEKRSGFPTYRVLFGIQLISMGVIYAASAGWLN